MNLYQATLDLLRSHAEVIRKKQELSTASLQQIEAEKSFASAYFSDENDSLTTPLVTTYDGNFWLIEVDEETGIPTRIRGLSYVWMGSTEGEQL